VLLAQLVKLVIPVIKVILALQVKLVPQAQLVKLDIPEIKVLQAKLVIPAIKVILE
jgi:hypothetical protein